MNDILIYVFGGVLILWNVILTVLVFKYKKDYLKILSGVDGKNLEETLKIHMERVEKAVQQNVKIESEFNDFKQFSKKFLYRVGFERFNPFQNTGGDQSFALSILDDSGDGIVISSMHSREATRVFAKPVKKGLENGYNFSSEEARVVKKSMNI